jgi:hypothetical protein
MMTNRSSRIPVCHLVTSTTSDLAAALGVGECDNSHRYSTSHFCEATLGGCALGVRDAEILVKAFEQIVRRYRAARATSIDRSIVASLENLFHLFFDAVERCLDLAADDCLCSWERRVGDAEKLTHFLFEAARAYWSTGAEREWMYKDLERLACLANEVSERDGSISRRADDDPSVEARADRLSVRLFDDANDLSCDNWAHEPWMDVVPTTEI